MPRRPIPVQPGLDGGGGGPALARRGLQQRPAIERRAGDAARRSAAARRKISRRSAAAVSASGSSKLQPSYTSFCTAAMRRRSGLGRSAPVARLIQRVVELLARRPTWARAMSVNAAASVSMRARRRGVDRDQTQLVAAPARRHQISGKHCGRAAVRW